MWKQSIAPRDARVPASPVGSLVMHPPAPRRSAGTRCVQADRGSPTLTGAPESGQHGGAVGPAAGVVGAGPRLPDRSPDIVVGAEAAQVRPGRRLPPAGATGLA